MSREMSSKFRYPLLAQLVLINAGIILFLLLH
jgi:hypothetical protein